MMAFRKRVAALSVMIASLGAALASFTAAPPALAANQPCAVVRCPTMNYHLPSYPGYPGVHLLNVYDRTGDIAASYALYNWAVMVDNIYWAYRNVDGWTDFPYVQYNKQTPQDGCGPTKDGNTYIVCEGVAADVASVGCLPDGVVSGQSCIPPAPRPAVANACYQALACTSNGISDDLLTDHYTVLLAGESQARLFTIVCHQGGFALGLAQSTSANPNASCMGPNVVTPNPGYNGGDLESLYWAYHGSTN